MGRLALLPLVAVLALPPAAARLSIWSAGAVEEAVTRLAVRYEHSAAADLEARFGTGPELEKLLASGQSADVLIAPAAVVERAVRSGKALAGTEAPVGRVGVGVVVRRGAPAPDVATVDALRAALLGADAVVYNQASTGQYLERLFARMGVLDRLAAKTTRYGNAAQVLEHLIAGSSREIGFGPVTEIKTFEPKGVALVGPLPADVQNYTTYVAAVLSAAKSREAAGQFIRYLVSAEARQTFRDTGVEVDR